MKHLLRAVLVLLATASMASAASFADIDQSQNQFDGGLSGAITGAAGFISGAGAAGEQQGIALSDTFGDTATGTSLQQQVQQDQSAFDNGDGNFAGSAWTTQQSQEDFVGTGGGIAFASQEQSMIGGAAGLSLGGQVGVAGSAGAAEAQGGTLALGVSLATNEQTQQFDGGYQLRSTSPNGGFVLQSGEQSFGTATATGAVFIGAAGAEASVVQAGGSLALNDGQGGQMSGEATAFGEADASAGSFGLAGAEASAFGTQTHTYTQMNLSADRTSQQMSTGTVTTNVSASAP